MLNLEKDHKTERRKEIRGKEREEIKQFYPYQIENHPLVSVLKTELLLD